MNPVRHVLATLATACLFAACGGGGANEGVALASRAEDGRLLATTTRNDQGVYTMRLPAQHSVGLSTDLSGAADLVVLTGRSGFSIGGCLRHATT